LREIVERDGGDDGEGACGGSAVVMVARRRKRVIRVAVVNFMVVACFL
jgi:hypothetical protein